MQSASVGRLRGSFRTSAGNHPQLQSDHALFRAHGSRSVPSRRRLSSLASAHCRVSAQCLRHGSPSRSVFSVSTRPVEMHGGEAVTRLRSIRQAHSRISAVRNEKSQTPRLPGPFSCVLCIFRPYISVANVVFGEWRRPSWSSLRDIRNVTRSPAGVTRACRAIAPDPDCPFALVPFGRGTPPAPALAQACFASSVDAHTAWNFSFDAAARVHVYNTCLHSCDVFRRFVNCPPSGASLVVIAKACVGGFRTAQPRRAVSLR